MHDLPMQWHQPTQPTCQHIDQESISLLGMPSGKSHDNSRKQGGYSRLTDRAF